MCANRAWRRCMATRSRRPASTRWPTKRRGWGGRRRASWSSTRTWGSRAGRRRPGRGFASWSVVCAWARSGRSSAWRCPAWPGVRPTCRAWTGSAYGVVGAFTERRFPRRAYGGAWAGAIRWGRLTHGRVLGILANPAYAGAYVFGRYRSRRTLTPDGTIRTKLISVPLPEWAVLIRDHHPGYINWETYLANRERLTAHCTHHGARPEREGRALCQGIVRCGSCGRGMSTTYPAGKPAYDCSRTRSDHTKTPGCRSVLAAMVDEVVAHRVLQVVAPEEI